MPVTTARFLLSDTMAFPSWQVIKKGVRYLWALCRGVIAILGFRCAALDYSGVSLALIRRGGRCSGTGDYPVGAREW